jgi:hypothetical protein
MTELEGQVCRLLFQEGVSSTEAAERLRLSPAEVVSIAVNSKGNGKSNTKQKPASSLSEESLDEGEQIRLLRQQVRQGLLSRTRPGAIDEIPAAALVRLWQLIEDPRLLNKTVETEDPFTEVIPEEIQDAIFRLLDSRQSKAGATS